jgi:hypothetical protein
MAMHIYSGIPAVITDYEITKRAKIRQEPPDRSSIRIDLKNSENWSHCSLPSAPATSDNFATARSRPAKRPRSLNGIVI